ncbi:SHOCT domain-containing protein [Chromobacterium haemolyticum]|uniref:SHOCT domain-containing protein n=1 Tax=Chromobacterium haemolyticum TaxID=394935 RepID=UPI0040569B13
MELFFVWIVFAVIVGCWADARGRNSVLFFFVSVLLSPLLAGLVLLITPNLKQEAKRQEQERADREIQLEQIKAIAKPAEPTSMASELEKLAGLRDRGVLTDAEFQQQKEKLLSAKV